MSDRFLPALFNQLYRSPLLYWAASDLASLGHWQTWQRLTLRYVGHGVLLDLGCGTGTLAYAAAGRRRRIVAVDRSWPLLRRAADRGIHPTGGPQFIQADGRTLPLRTSSVDGIVVTFPTEIIFSLTVAREMARVLNPGGRAAVLLGATPRPSSLCGVVMLALLRLALGARTGTEHHIAHRLPFQRAGLEQRDITVDGRDWIAWLVLLRKPMA